MKLIWNGHACFTLDTGKDVVVFDPYSPGSVPGWILPQLHGNAVFCSHDHGDHNYKEGVVIEEKRLSLAMRQIHCFHDNEQGKLRGTNLITVIEADNLSIAHFGDIGHMLSREQIDALGHIDVMLLPVGGHYTIGAEEAKQLADTVGATAVIPMHYKGKDYGYDVLSPVDSFLEMYDRQKIVTLHSYMWEFSNDLPNAVIVFG